MSRPLHELGVGPLHRRGTERLVLLALADCANDEGRECWPSVATLARKCRVDERTVQRVIRRLAEGGHLLILPSSGGRAANRYSVLMCGYPQPRPSVTPGNLPPRQDATAPPAQVPGQGWHSCATRTSLNVIEPSTRASHEHQEPRRYTRSALTTRRRSQPASIEHRWPLPASRRAVRGHLYAVPLRAHCGRCPMSAHLLRLADRIAAMFGAGTTGRTASVDFGPSTAAVYRAELALFTDAELYAHGERIVARLRRGWSPYEIRAELVRDTDKAVRRGARV
jgi:hypothetical protein